MGQTVLEMTGIKKSFAGIYALNGIDFSLELGEVHTVINELAKEGIAIIMVSSELPEIINMCDNVCVIRAGKLVGKLGKDQMNQEEIMKYAAGGVE